LQVRILNDAAELGRAAAELTAEAAAEAIVARGAFHLILAGGNTPRVCYEVLRYMPLDWARVHIWFGDERCVQSGHAERNDRMAEETLLSHVPIPVGQIHRMPAELGPVEGAESYAAELAAAPVADMLHLGMGEDGHTASLFPGNPALSDTRLAVPVFDSPKPPPERVSLGLSALNAARRKLILAAGAGKRQAIARIRTGERLPAALITDALWLLDRAAAGEG
jgi:6-phosphogluconolactonase